ncbi:MAG: hypothetical protein J6Y07_02725 [Alphaproteobacteria bacterium]|nr:hypothetical protein [Alphaproteobacteria bacterium]
MPTLLIFIGSSNTGKTTYIKDHLIKEGLFHLIRSYTTRPLREGEKPGFPYTVKPKTFFRRNVKKFAVRIFANKTTYKTDGKEWHYGVTKEEIDHYAKEGRNLVYDVIQPCYAKSMIDYVKEKHPQYNVKIAWFLPPKQEDNVVAERENMLNGVNVRKKNSCTQDDILNAGLTVDYKLCPKGNQFNQQMEDDIAELHKEMMCAKAEIYGFPFSK